MDVLLLVPTLSSGVRRVVNSKHLHMYVVVVLLCCCCR